MGIAKILAGCRLQTYYPITPASDESEYLEAHENIELEKTIGDEAQAMQGAVTVVQTEDEIAAITMAVGGALTGTRASTSTSGPGFSLMCEGMGWAGINEVPVVITLYQRGGPSTGLPTRHEQGDLRFALHAGHGDFPRIVLASGDLEEMFYDVPRSFNYAEKYQLPVVHIVDKAMANSDMTYKIFDPSLAKIERGKLIKDFIPGHEGEYFERYKQTVSGVSPRPAIGTKGGIYWNTGDEHDERGPHLGGPDQQGRHDGEEDEEARTRSGGDTGRGEGALLRAEGRADDPRQLGFDQGSHTRRDGGAQRGGHLRELPPDTAHQPVPDEIREGTSLELEGRCRC